MSSVIVSAVILPRFYTKKQNGWVFKSDFQSNKSIK